MYHFKYLSYVLRHKWYVFVECCKLGTPLRGILHDLSKFLPSEWFPYARHFYGNLPNWDDVKRICPTYQYKNTKQGNKDLFDIAWLLHQKRNKHHWQYWLLLEDNPINEFTLQGHYQGGEISLSRNNRPLAVFDESILFEEDKVVPNVCNSNASLYAKEIRDRLNRKIKVLPMPDKYRKEMLADWKGAGKAQGYKQKDECKKWYLSNKSKMLLHPATTKWIEEHLGINDAE